MRRFAIVVATVVVAVAAVLAIGFALLPREALKTRIAEQISAWTGRGVSLRGEPQITFFPRLAVTLTDVEIGGPPDMPDAVLLSTDELTGTIRLLPLLIGSVEIESFRLLRPDIRLVRGDGEKRNWALDSGAAALQLAFAGDVPLGEFLLQDGSLTYENLATGQREVVEAIDISVDWSSIRQPFALSGSATWRGEPLTLSLGAAEPFAFLKRDPTPVQARLETPSLQISFTGEASREDEIRVAGQLDARSPSLQRFAAWAGHPIAPALPGPASLSGNAAVAGGSLTVDAARLDLDGQSATGALSLSFGPRPTLAGTLAFASLDLGSLFAAAIPSPASGAWREVKVDTDWFSRFGADLRLSASSVAAGSLQFGPTAATVSLRDQVLEVGVGEAVIGGGGLSGDLTVTDAPDGAGSTAQAQLRGTNLALGDLGLGFAPELAGAATLATDLQSGGATLGDHLRSLAGTASLSIAEGAIADPGLAQLAAAPAGGSALAADGRSIRFSELTAELRFEQEEAILEAAHVATPTWTADLSGQIGLADGALALAGELTPVTAGPAVPRPFSVDGTLADPIVRRAGAAN